jgi:hypothetical protein
MIKMLISILIALLLPQFTAFARRGGQGGEVEERSKACDTAAVNACKARHREAISLVQSWLANETPKIESSAEKLRMIEEVLAKISLKHQIARKKIHSLEREARFIGKNLANPEPLLGGRLSISSLYGLSTQDTSWGERYPSERLRLLSDSLSQERANESDLKSQVMKISTEHTLANEQLQEGISRKNKWLQEIHEHGGMSEEGCRSEICPYTN